MGSPAEVAHNGPGPGRPGRTDDATIPVQGAQQPAVTERRTGDHVASIARRSAARVASRPVPAPAAGGRASGDAVWALARAIADVVLLSLASAVVTSQGPDGLGPAWNAGAVPVTLAALCLMGAYRPRLRLQLGGELGRVAAATAGALVIVGAGAMLVSGRIGAGDAAVAQWPFVSGVIGVGRVALFALQRTLRARTDRGGRTLVVGAGVVGHTTAKRLLDEPQLGLRPVGFLDKEPLLAADECARRGLPTLPILGASWDLEQVVAEAGIDHVVVAFSTAPHEVLVDLVRRCWKLGVDVLLVPRLYEVAGSRMTVEHLGALPLMSVRATDPGDWRFLLKYALDRMVAAVALVALAPLLAVLALATLRSVGRPVLFRQRRVGRDGRVFEILKFRTMRGAPERDGDANALWASQMLADMPTPGVAPPLAEDRRTRVGVLLRALSLDELPQLWNVLRGDMSLVGPRPEMPHYVERFEHAIPRYPERHRVKAGLTGWAQVHGLRGNTSLADRIEWDNFYIENWSPWLDLKILWMTLPAVLSRRGAR